METRERSQHSYMWIPGATTVGVVCSEGVILASEKRVSYGYLIVSKTGKKVFKASNISELIKMYKLALKVISREEIIVQEIIPGASKNLFSFCPVMNNGEVIAAVTAQRLRQHPMDFGRATTYAVTKRVPELELSGTEILKAVSYNGLAEVEFIYDKRDGIYKFLEVNPRIWGWHSIAGAAGINLPYIAYKNAVGTENIKSPVFNETNFDIYEIISPKSKIISRVLPCWRSSPFIFNEKFMLFKSGNLSTGKNFPTGADWSKALAISHGSPFFFCSACKSRAVKSIPIPISSKYLRANFLSICLPLRFILITISVS